MLYTVHYAILALGSAANRPAKWDLTRLEMVQDEVRGILADFPTLDTVFVNAGIQNYYNIFEQPADDREIIRELTVDLTAPVLVAQAFASHLLTLARSGTKTNLFLTSSSLAYFPVPFYPTYCAAKAGIAAFVKILRMQLEGTDCRDMNVVEVAPQYVDTPLNASHRDQTDALQGGKDKAVQPMPLDEYIDRFFTALEQTNPDGSFKKEIGVGLATKCVDVWYEGYRKLLSASGMAD